TEIGFAIGGTDEDTLSQLDHFETAIAWPIALGRARDEAFEVRGLGLADGMHLCDLDQPLAAQVLRDILAATDIGQMIAEPRAAENPASFRFEDALWPFKHNHIIGLAAGVVDSRDHADEKHLANCGAIVAALGAEIVRKPRVDSRLAVPFQSVEIVAHGVKRMLARVLGDRLVRRILAEAPEAEPLQPLLHGSNVRIGSGPALKMRIIAK